MLISLESSNVALLQGRSTHFSIPLTMDVMIAAATVINMKGELREYFGSIHKEVIPWFVKTGLLFNEILTKVPCVTISVAKISPRSRRQ